jgi:hypothetical protein
MMYQNTIFANCDNDSTTNNIVLTLKDFPRAEMTSLIASGVAMIPPSSTYMISKESGSSFLAYLMKRQVSDVL